MATDMNQLNEDDMIITIIQSKNPIRNTRKRKDKFSQKYRKMFSEDYKEPNICQRKDTNTKQQ